MIEELKNTAVRVENEQQARCVVALYELAGFEQFGNSMFEGYVSTDDDRCFYWGVTIIDKDLITLDQLAWDYNLAPKWATQLDVYRGVFYYSDGKTAFNIANKREIGITSSDDDADEIISTRPQVKRVLFKSGQPVYIAQINTLAGITSKRYFVEQCWCNSAHQQEYVALGIIFDNKHDAENKCRELLGIPLIKTEREEFIEKSIQVAKESNPDFAETTNTKLAFGSQYDAGARFND